MDAQVAGQSSVRTGGGPGARHRNGPFLILSSFAHGDRGQRADPGDASRTTDGGASTGKGARRPGSRGRDGKGPVHPNRPAARRRPLPLRPRPPAPCSTSQPSLLPSLPDPLPHASSSAFLPPAAPRRPARPALAPLPARPPSSSAGSSQQLRPLAVHAPAPPSTWSSARPPACPAAAAAAHARHRAPPGPTLAADRAPRHSTPTPAVAAAAAHRAPPSCRPRPLSPSRATPSTPRPYPLSLSSVALPSADLGPDRHRHHQPPPRPSAAAAAARAADGARELQGRRRRWRARGARAPVGLARAVRGDD